jgi:hypothetical protein
MNLYRLPIGAPYPMFQTNSVGTNAVLNATGVAAEWVFQSHTTDPITKLGFSQNTITGSPPVYKISLQGVDASGNADGVIKASATFTPTLGNNGSWVWVTLDSSYTPARGEFLAIVISYVSGTIDNSNRLIVFAYVNSNGMRVSFPYYIANNAGTRTRADGTPTFGYATASQAFGYPSSGSTTSAAFGSTSNPNEYGFKFSFLGTGNGTYKIAGARIVLTAGAASIFKIQLYQGGNAGDTTILQDATFDTDYFGVNGRLFNILFDETALATLNCGDTYRLSIAPQGSTNQTIYLLNVASAADMEAYAGGANFTLSTRNGGNWTDVPTQRILGEILLDSFTPSGAGSSRGIYTGGRL